jgi:thioredoxin 1
MSRAYDENEPARAAIDVHRGPLLLEFGSNTCGHCRRAQPLIEQALGGHPGLAHVKVADGPGRPLGRSFRVKLWPTLVFIKDGAERARAVRPQGTAEIEAGLKLIAAP